MLAASRLAPLRGTVGKLPVHPAPRYSPMLSNVYLNYVFDLWIRWWRESRCHGEMIVVRYADDFVIGFEHRAEAEACLDELRARFAKFGLKLHDGKTRLLEFGRFAATNRKRRGEKRQQTLRLPRVHTQVCEAKERREFHHPPSYDREADAGDIISDPVETAQANAPPVRRGGTLVAESCARLDELSCSAEQQRMHPAFYR